MKLSELEVKIKLDHHQHFKQIFETCRELYGAPSSRLQQLDHYYDTPDEQLKKQDLVIRIRSNGTHKTIALKSPRVLLPSGISNRIELEFAAAEKNNVEEQIKSQGLNVSHATEKERWTFVKDDIEIVLDRLPFLGYFIEVEGPDEAAINEVLNSLGLSISNALTNHYGELLTEKLEELGLNPTIATFSAEAEWTQAYK